MLENTYEEEAGSSVCLRVKTSVPWLIFLIRQLQRGRVITVETRSEGDDEKLKYKPLPTNNIKKPLQL